MRVNAFGRERVVHHLTPQKIHHLTPLKIQIMIVVVVIRGAEDHTISQSDPGTKVVKLKTSHRPGSALPAF